MVQRDRQYLADLTDLADQFDMAATLRCLLKPKAPKNGQASRPVSLRSLGIRRVQLHGQHQGGSISQTKGCRLLTLQMECSGLLQMLDGFI